MLEDDDLYGGQTPPTGPAPVGDYQVHAPGQGGESGEGEEQNGFSPGTLDVTIEKIYLDVLQPQANPLEGINALDAIIRKAERGEAVTEGEAGAARAAAALDAQQRREIETARVLACGLLKGSFSSGKSLLRRQW